MTYPMYPPYKIGTTSATLELLENLGIEPPVASVPDYENIIQLGNGKSLGVGGLQCSWVFGFIREDQAQVLRGYTGTCCIQTLNENGSYTSYNCVMLQPKAVPPKAGYCRDFIVEFKLMVIA